METRRKSCMVVVEMYGRVVIDWKRLHGDGKCGGTLLTKGWRTSSMGQLLRGQNKIGGRCEKQRGIRVRSLRRVETRRKSCMEDGDR